MHAAFSKHALLANLRSVGPWAGMLGVLATLAAPAASASATTGGGTSTVATTPTTPTPAPTAVTPTTAAAPPASGSTSGGAAPEPTTGKPTLATWFGPGFYGHATACGQRLTPQLVGVANRTLPCGTLVQIGYRGHALTVPVLDRGPYGHNGAAWDLTAGAARGAGDQGHRAHHDAGRGEPAEQPHARRTAHVEPARCGHVLRSARRARSRGNGRGCRGLKPQPAYAASPTRGAYAASSTGATGRPAARAA